MWGATYIKTYIKKHPLQKTCIKKHPLQNRTNVQIKGGGAKGLLSNVQKNCTFLKWGLPLCSKSSWMGRVIPLRLLALPAELKQLCSSSLVVGSRNISMNGCLVHKQGCLSQPPKGFFTCSPGFTCFLVIGRRVGRRLVVSCVSVSVCTQRDQH